MLTYVNRKCVLMFTPAFPVSRFIAIVFYNLQQVHLVWLTVANLKSFSASTRGGITKVQRCMHKVGSAHDASTVNFKLALNLTVFGKWILDLWKKISIYKTIIIILFWWSILCTFYTPPGSLNLTKA